MIRYRVFLFLILIGSCRSETMEIPNGMEFALKNFIESGEVRFIQKYTESNALRSILTERYVDSDDYYEFKEFLEGTASRNADICAGINMYSYTEGGFAMTTYFIDKSRSYVNVADSIDGDLSLLVERQLCN